MTENQKKYGTFVGVSQDDFGMCLVVYPAGSDSACRILLTLDDARTLINVLTSALVDRVLNSSRILTHTFVDPQQIGPSGTPIPMDLRPGSHQHEPAQAAGKRA